MYISAVIIKTAAFLIIGLVLNNHLGQIQNRFIIPSVLITSALIIVQKIKRNTFWSFYIPIHCTLLGWLHGYSPYTFDFYKNLDQTAFKIEGCIQKYKQKDNYTSITLEVQNIQQEEKAIYTKNLSIYLTTSCTEAHDWKVGQKLSINPIELKDPYKNTYYSIGFLNWLKQNNISYITRLNLCEHYTHKKQVGLLVSSRQKIISLINETFKNPGVNPIIKALIIGDKSSINKEVKTIYTKTGALHILAISGLHVGIIFGIPFLLLAKLKQRKIIRYVVSLGIVLCFTLITGASPSVSRAAVMLLLFSITNYFGKPTYSLQIVALTGLGFILIKPNQIEHLGFLLSFSAVIGIITIYPYLIKRITFKHQPIRLMWEITAVSISAQVGTFGLCLFYFKQFSLSFILSGLIVIPLAPIVIYSSILSLILSSINPLWGQFIGQFTASLLNFQTNTLKKISDIDILFIEDIVFPVEALIIYYLLLLMLIIYRGPLIWKLLITILGFILICSFQEKSLWR